METSFFMLPYSLPSIFMITLKTCWIFLLFCILFSIYPYQLLSAKIKSFIILTCLYRQIRVKKSCNTVLLMDFLLSYNLTIFLILSSWWFQIIPRTTLWLSLKNWKHKDMRLLEYVLNLINLLLEIICLLVTLSIMLFSKLVCTSLVY